jgi:hypothetical protein
MSATDTTGTQAPLEARSRRRQHIIGASIVAVVLIAAVAIPTAWQRLTAEPPLSAPTFGATDGLPEVLESGREYTGRITVALAADWARVAAADGRTEVLWAATITTADYPEGILFCSGSVVPGSETTVLCPMEAITGLPGLPSVVTVQVGDPWGMNGDDVPTASTTYQHVFG